MRQVLSFPALLAAFARRALWFLLLPAVFGRRFLLLTLRLLPAFCLHRWDDFYLQKTADLTAEEDPGNTEPEPETPSETTKKLTTPKIKSVSVKKQTITVKWGKVSNAAGYKVQYSTKKNFKGAKVKKVSSGKKVSVKINTKKKKTKFYVRVCATAKAGSKYKASAYSKAKNIKTK